MFVQCLGILKLVFLYADCPPDTFDPPLCNGTCHCKNGPSQCDPVSGLCEDYQCSWGWGSPPYCQDREYFLLLNYSSGQENQIIIF